MAEAVNTYHFSDDGLTGVGTLPSGEEFLFDAADFDLIAGTKWYRCNGGTKGYAYVGDKDGVCIHRVIMGNPKGMEIDHANLNTLDNRRSNLRVCSHQQNQCNQPLQSNNTSGITGVSFYPPRGKWRARIKYLQRELHLGYFLSKTQAIQARNEGMRHLFGEYGRYSDVPDAPPGLKNQIAKRCSRFLKEAAFS